MMSSHSETQEKLRSLCVDVAGFQQAMEIAQVLDITLDMNTVSPTMTGNRKLPRMKSWEAEPNRVLDERFLKVPNIRVVNAYFSARQGWYTKQSEPPITLDEAIIQNSIIKVRKLLRKASMIGVDFEGTTLTGLDLASASLCGSVLRNTELTGARLFRTNLTQADLRNACLRNAQMNGAKMKGSNMSGADLRGANLAYATGLRYANLDNVTYSERTTFPAGFRPHSGMRKTR